MQVCIIAVIAATLALQDVRAFVVTSPMWICWVGILVSQCAVLTSSLFVLRQTRVDLRCGSKQQAEKRLETRFFLHRFVWLAASVMVVTCFRWPEFVATISPSRLLSRPLVLVPILLPLVGSWAILFGIESELDPTAAKVGRWRFVLGRARQLLLLPLFAILLVVGWQDIVTSIATSWAGRFQNEVGLGVVRVLPLFAMMFLFPVLLRRTWRTHPLKHGTLREKLEQHGERAGFRSRDILVWNTERSLRNAAVAGIVPRWRYVFLSDGLLNDLATEHVECVFLHEVGHIQNRHPIRLLITAFLVFALGVATISMAWAPGVSVIVKLGAVLGVCVGVFLFGRLARLFELQADLWAARNTKGPELEYLRAIASISGGDDPDARSWLHPSFQQRCDVLLRGIDPSEAWIRTQLWRTAVFVAILIGWYGMLAGISLMR